MAEDVSILTEIDEALRADKLQEMWLRNGKAILVFCALTVLATIGSVLWKNHLHDKHEAQTSLLAEASAFEQKGRNDDAIALYEKAENEGGALGALAGLRHAAVLISLKQDDKAMALYLSIAGGKLGDAPAELRDFADLQASVLASNKGLTVPRPAGTVNSNVFHDSAAEIDALNAHKAGDDKTATTLLGSIVSDEAAPYSQRVRAQEIFDAIKAKEPRK